MKVLITGISGFTGRYLTAELKAAGHQVFGLVHRELASNNTGADAHFVADLCDEPAIMRIVNEVQPDWVVHLAAISFVAHGKVDEIYHTNVVGTRCFLNALTRADVQLRAVLIASSANVYGNAQEGALDESAAVAPANDYAVSKLAMEYVARLYFDRLPIVLVRPFNYTGVGQPEHFLIPKIIQHVRRRAPVIELGNLDVARDFSDVRMVVAYYRRLLENPSTIGQVLNVCTGQAHTLQQVLDYVREISQHNFTVQVNPAFVRANEVRLLLGNRSRLLRYVPDVPDIPLENTLRWMLDVD